MSIGLLILRLVVGLALAGHGTQKLFGWFGGYGLSGTAGFLEQLGFVPGRRSGWSRGRRRAARETAGARSAKAHLSDLKRWSFKLLGPLIILPPGAR